MSDNNSTPNYQEILDKYAASLNSSDQPLIAEPPQPEPISPPEPPSSEPISPPEPPQPEPISPPENLLESPQLESPSVTLPLESTPPEAPIELSPTPPEAPIELSPPPTPTPISPTPPQVELPLTSPNLNPPRENHFFKYLFIFSLLVFIAVLVSVVIAFINSQKATSIPKTSSEDILSPTASPTMFCEINDKKYAIDQKFPATDGCNTCSCTADLTVVCTEMACDATNSATTSTTNLDTYTNSVAGVSFKYPSIFNYSEKADPYYLVSANPLIKINIHSKNDPRIDECLKLTDTETSNNLTIKKYSFTSSDFCGTTIDSDRQIWITQTDKDESQPGIIFSFSSSQSTESEKIFSQILPSIKFL